MRKTIERALDEVRGLPVGFGIDANTLRTKLDRNEISGKAYLLALADLIDRYEGKADRVRTTQLARYLGELNNEQRGKVQAVFEETREQITNTIKTL